MTYKMYRLLLTLCVLSSASIAFGDYSKLVRMKLFKKTSMQSGQLGQPVTSYFANVDLGTPAKPFKLLVDVNALELWVPHYLKLGIVYSRLNYKNGYSKQASSTSVKEQGENEIDYKGCKLTGKAYTDLIELKDITESLKPVRYEQRFLAISSASNDKFTRFEGVDGVLPINPWPVSLTGSDMTPKSLQRARLIDKLKFGLLLDQDLTTTTGGEITFGSVNPTNFVGDLKYHNVIAQHSWELALHQVMLGAHTIGNCQSRTHTGIATCAALLSTASNDIYGPINAIQSILKLLGILDTEKDGDFKADKLYEIDCLKVATSPMLTFIIDGAYYMLPPASYIRKKVDGLIFKSETCYIALLSNGSDNKWELGTNFLSNYYTVFDADTHQVGFGQRK